MSRAGRRGPDEEYFTKEVSWLSLESEEALDDRLLTGTQRRAIGRSELAQRDYEGIRPVWWNGAGIIKDSVLWKLFKFNEKLTELSGNL